VKKETQEQFLLHTVMENILEHIYFKDLESRVHCGERNPKPAATGWRPAPWWGKTDFDLFSDKHARQAFGGRKAHHPDRRADDRSGGSRETWTESNRTPGFRQRRCRSGTRRAGSSAPSASPATSLDRRRAEEALRENEEKFHALADSAQDANRHAQRRGSDPFLE